MTPCVNCHKPMPSPQYTGSITGEPYCWRCAKSLFQVDAPGSLGAIAAGSPELQARLRELRARFAKRVVERSWTGESE